jgi:hypothetical protein
MLRKVSIFFVSIFVVAMFIFSAGKLQAEEHCKYKKASGILKSVDYKIENMGFGDRLYILRLDFEDGRILILSQTRRYDSLYFVRGKKNEICYKKDDSNVVEYVKIIE